LNIVKNKCGILIKDAEVVKNNLKHAFYKIKEYSNYIKKNNLIKKSLINIDQSNNRILRRRFNLWHSISSNISQKQLVFNRLLNKNNKNNDLGLNLAKGLKIKQTKLNRLKNILFYFMIWRKISLLLKLNEEAKVIQKYIREQRLNYLKNKQEAIDNLKDLISKYNKSNIISTIKDIIQQLKSNKDKYLSEDNKLKLKTKALFLMKKIDKIDHLKNIFWLKHYFLKWFKYLEDSEKYAD